MVELKDVKRQFWKWKISYHLWDQTAEDCSTIHWTANTKNSQWSAFHVSLTHWLLNDDATTETSTKKGSKSDQKFSHFGVFAPVVASKIWAMINSRSDAIRVIIRSIWWCNLLSLVAYFTPDFLYGFINLTASTFHRSDRLQHCWPLDWHHNSSTRSIIDTFFARRFLLITGEIL